MGSYKDKKPLLEQPGAMNKAGTGKKQVKVPRSTFRVSIGHGTPSAGKQESASGETLDQTISYPVGPGRPQPMGKAGSFGTPYHQGKAPLNYEEDLPSYMLEY